MNVSFWEIPSSGGARFNNESRGDSGRGHGHETAWWMVSGETRVGPAAEIETLGSLCSMDTPSKNTPGCPGVGQPIYLKTGTTQSGTIVGHCCTSQKPSAPNYVCGSTNKNSDCGQCTVQSGDVPGSSTGWRSCKTQGLAQSCGDVNSPWVCYDRLTYASVSPDGGRTCLHGISGFSSVDDGSSGHTACANNNCKSCGQVTQTCVNVTSPDEFNRVKNWVGGEFTPVLGHPRMRGMSPRGMYRGSTGTPTPTGVPAGNFKIDVDCGTTNNPYYFSSAPTNVCFLFYPRPATSSVFVRGASTTTNGDYRRTYYDPDYGTYFKRFTHTSFSAGIDVGGSDSEALSTFFPFWTPSVRMPPFLPSPV
jgi:hypothetical protein